MKQKIKMKTIFDVLESRVDEIMNVRQFAPPDPGRLVYAVLNGLAEFGLLDDSHYEIVQYAEDIFGEESEK